MTKFVTVSRVDYSSGSAPGGVAASLPGAAGL